MADLSERQRTKLPAPRPPTKGAIGVSGKRTNNKKHEAQFRNAFHIFTDGMAPLPFKNYFDTDYIHRRRRHWQHFMEKDNFTQNCQTDIIPKIFLFSTR